MCEYTEYGFDQQRLLWYVFHLWDMVLFIQSTSLQLQCFARLYFAIYMYIEEFWLFQYVQVFVN